MLAFVINSPVFLFLFEHGLTIALGILLLLTIVAWIMTPQFLRRRFLIILMVAAAALRILFSVLKTMAQHYVWSHDALGRLFLAPFAPRGYFWGYVGTHFWLGTGIAIAVGLAAYLFLWALQHYRSRFFEGGELELGTLLCLIMGWPGVIVFVAGTCVGIIIVSIVRRIWLAQAYTTLGIPMLIGGVLAFALNTWLVTAFGLGLLRA